MKVNALTSFAGAVSMHLNQTLDIPEGEILDDLIASGYVQAVEKEVSPQTRKKLAADKELDDGAVKEPDDGANKEPDDDVGKELADGNGDALVGNNENQ